MTWKISFLALGLLLLSGNALAAPEPKTDYDAMYSNCMKGHNINNNILAICSSTVSVEATKEINILYKKAYSYIATKSPKDGEQFKQTQQAWLTYRNGQCALAGSYVGSPMYNYCPMLLNIARVKELRELANDR
jgi:uncharacterized protein YecT (DUF1311 family)